jgi:hypothetical protein
VPWHPCLRLPAHPTARLSRWPQVLLTSSSHRDRQRVRPSAELGSELHDLVRHASEWSGRAVSMPRRTTSQPRRSSITARLGPTIPTAQQPRRTALPGACAKLLFMPVAEAPARSALSRADAVPSGAREMMGSE